MTHFHIPQAQKLEWQRRDAVLDMGGPMTAARHIREFRQRQDMIGGYLNTALSQVAADFVRRVQGIKVQA